MFTKSYPNFVRPIETVPTSALRYQSLSGDEARKLYLEEVKEIKDPLPDTGNSNTVIYQRVKIRKRRDTNISDKDFFLVVQNNDVDTLREVLHSQPDKINLLDDYGWSLLMIACQANSEDAVKELLDRNIDTSVRDKAGNSAQSLVIKNRNIKLAELLLNYSKNKQKEIKDQSSNKKVKLKETFTCETCDNKSFSDKEEHLSSTIHNINASKGKKIPVNYVIPETNRGFQIMLKVGWDKEGGLGPDGSGKQYPIKAVRKKDRKGLGNERKVKMAESIQESVKQINRKEMQRVDHNQRQMEIEFRRQFY